MFKFTDLLYKSVFSTEYCKQLNLLLMYTVLSVVKIVRVERILYLRLYQGLQIWLGNLRSTLYGTIKFITCSTAIVQSHVRKNQIHRNRSLYIALKMCVCSIVYCNVQLVHKSLSDRAVATIGAWEPIAPTNRNCPR